MNLTYRVVDVRPIDDCLDETLTREIELGSPLDEPLMRLMAQEAELSFYPDFPRPYFRIERRGAFVAQGVLGNRSFRVTLSARERVHTLEHLIRTIEKGEFDDG